MSDSALNVTASSESKSTANSAQSSAKATKKPLLFQGVGCALVTPFASGKIDYAALGRLIDFQIASGVDALIVGGTTGEAATLTDAERYDLFRFAKERASGKIRLIFGTGTNDTAKAIAHTKAAERVGADGVLAVTPYYNKGTKQGLLAHYRAIAEAVSLPVLLYNVPARTGVNLSLSLLEKLAEIPNIVGIKEAGDSADRLSALAAFGERLPLYAGNDSQFLTVLALGGAGVISVVANLLPERFVALDRAFRRGNLSAARTLQFSLLALIRALFAETNPAPIKYALSECGLCKPELRLPLSEPEEKTKEQLHKAIAELKSSGDFPVFESPSREKRVDFE